METWVLRGSLIIFCLIGRTVITKDKTDQLVYVNFLSGSKDNISCGSISKPCKYLQTAFDKFAHEVILIDTIPLNTTVIVRRNLTIRGIGRCCNAAVKGERIMRIKTVKTMIAPGYYMEYNKTEDTGFGAFTLLDGISVNITGIKFIDVGIVVIGTKSTVVIDDCYSTGIINEVIQPLNSYNNLYDISLSVTNSTFQNIRGVVLNDRYFIKKPYKVRFINCRFRNISCYGESSKYKRLKIEVITISQADFLSISNCLFRSVSKCNGVVNIRGKSTQVLIRDSIFRENTVDRNVLHDMGSDVSIVHCHFFDNKMRTDAVVSFTRRPFAGRSSLTFITDTNFYNNSGGGFSHAIHHRSEGLTLHSVSITSFNARGSLYHISSETDKFKAEKVILHIQQPGKGTISNGMIVSSPNIDDSSSLSFICPTNFKVQFQYNSRLSNILNMICESCAEGRYSVLNGKLQLDNLVYIEEDLDKGKINCRKCPIGGLCEDGRLISSSNFWGYNKSNQVVFLPCPITYCCTAEGMNCRSYNTCSEGRTGVLCGQCEVGYRLNMFNSSCIKANDKCDIGLFVFYMIAYSWCISLFFMYVTNITNILKRIWKTIKRRAARIISCQCFMRRVEPFLLRIRIFDRLQSFFGVSLQREVCSASTKIPKQLVLHMLVLYYQLAKLLHVDVEKKDFKKGFLESATRNITDFFHLKFIVPVHQKVCPLSDLDFITKAAVNMIIQLTTATNLFLFFVVVKIFIFLKQEVRIQFIKWSITEETDEETHPIHDDQQGDHEESEEVHDDEVRVNEVTIESGVDLQHEFNREVETIMDDNEIQLLEAYSDEEKKEVQPMTFTVRLKLTFIKLLTIIYTPVSYICFQLTYCVKINNSDRLYLSGEVECYNWWQKIILFAVLPGIIVFPLSLGMSLHLIKTGQITTTEFLAAVGVPYYGIYLYLKMLVVGPSSGCYTEKDAEFIDKQLQKEDENYRRREQLISWPVVQLYRNLLIAAVRTVIINPIYQTLTFLPIFFIFLLHDRSAKPFHNKSINVFQASSTACLSIIVICNIVFSFSLFMTNIETIQNMDIVLNILSYIERVVYFLFPLVLPIAIIWRKYLKKGKDE